MKKFSRLGLAAIGAMAMMAVIGASAASAEVCSTSGTGAECGGTHGKVYTGKIVATIATPAAESLSSGFIRVTCGESTIEGEVTNGETGAGKITKWTEGDCHSNLNTTSSSCTASTNASATNPWPASVSVTTAPSGTMTVDNLTTTVDCNVFGSNITCRYAATTASVSVNGSDSAPTVVLSGVPVTKEPLSGTSCSSTATLSGTYRVTTPSSLFIT